MKDAGIPTAIYYPLPMHQQPAYEHFEHGPLPVSEQLCGEVLSLPMHPYLTDDQIALVCEALIGQD
jgi:dTDP-4-amino-4,6-dideoxygalactose transaminase